MDSYETFDNIYIVTEYLSGPNLVKYFLKRNRTEYTVKRVMQEIFIGLSSLHKLGIAHRDIKLDNIMMTNDTEESVPKLIDFGLAKMFYIGETSDDRYGTLAFCSPEVILGRAHDIGTDVWSLGIVLHYLISGTIPFLSRDKNDTKKNIIW